MATEECVTMCARARERRGRRERQPAIAVDARAQYTARRDRPESVVTNGPARRPSQDPPEPMDRARPTTTK